MRDSYLDDYYSFLRFASVSTDDQYKEKVNACAQWLVKKMQTIGLETQLVPTSGHPVVWARNKQQAGRRTVMIYGHYDVQPPDPLELWDSPPFEPVLKDGYVFGGAVANPITALARLLATLHDEKGHVAIEGFYDKVKPLEDWERKAWRELPVDGDKAILDETGAPGLFGEESYTTLERIWGRPTAELNGIGGGYQGMGTKTVIASHAMAKLTFRLVPDQEGDEILSLAEKHLQQHLPPGVTMEITRGHSGPWYRTDPHSQFAEAAQRALRAVFGKDPAIIREGGAI